MAGLAVAPLAEQITVALAQLRHAREGSDVDRELFWQTRLDHLLDIYAATGR